jgi:hypothetical protein
MTGLAELQADRKTLNRALDNMATATTPLAKASAARAAEASIYRPFVDKSVKVAYTPAIASIAAGMRSAAFDGGGIGRTFDEALAKVAATNGVTATNIPQMVRERIRKLVA